MDALLANIVREADADPNVVGLVLHGSRSVGHDRPGSDYDLFFVLKAAVKPVAREHVESAWVTFDELRAAEPTWWTDGMVQGQLLLDKSGGELERVLARLGEATDVETPYDGYLNSFVRGKAAARRGDELGARLHAADSVRYLAEALAALDGRRPRFHDRLAGHLGEWEPRLLAILRDPDVDVQRALQRDVQRLMESRGVRTHETWKPDQLL
jgi:hypothetical protein